LPVTPPTIIRSLKVHYRFFNLDEEQHDQVLGQEDVQHVLQVLDTRIAVCTRHPFSGQVAAPEMTDAVAVPLSEEGFE
jgi:hypothetical protein